MFENPISKEKTPYLFLRKTETKDGFDKLYMQECNSHFKWIDGNGNLHDYYCIAGDSLMYSDGINESIISTEDGLFVVLVKNDDNTNLIENNKRFIINGSAYYVSHKDNVTYSTLTEKGVLRFILKRDVINNVTDDVVNGVADRFKNLDRYEVQLSPAIVNFNVGQTQQLTVSVLKNGIPIVSPNITYSTSDNTKVIIDSTGLVTAISESNNVLITASYIDNLGNSYSATTNVNVITPIVPDNFTYSFTSSTGMFKVRPWENTMFTPKKINNGIEVTGVLWDFTISNYVAPVSAITVTVNTITDSSLKIKQTSNNLTSGSLLLTATIRGTAESVNQIITFSN